MELSGILDTNYQTETLNCTKYKNDQGNRLAGAAVEAVHIIVHQHQYWRN